MEAKQVVEEYFDALDRGDMESVFSYFSPEARWSQPGQNKFSGFKNNLDEIVNMLGLMMRDTNNSIQVSLNGPVMENAGLVAAPVWFKALKSDKALDMGGVDLFRVESGKIVQVWTFSAVQPEEDDFWGRS